MADQDQDRDLRAQRGLKGGMNLQLFAEGDPGAPPAGVPTADQPTPEQIAQWRAVAEDFEGHAQQLQTREQEIQAQAQQLEMARQIDEAMRNDPAFREALQEAFARRVQPGQSVATPTAPQDPTQLAAQLPPQLLRTLQEFGNRLGQVTQTTQALETQQRQGLIESQVSALSAKYPFAEADQVVDFLMEYPKVSVEAAMAASNQHYQTRFQQADQALREARARNAAGATLGPSGAAAAPIDRSALATPGGRREAMQKLAAILAAQQNGG